MIKSQITFHIPTDSPLDLLLRFLKTQGEETVESGDYKDVTPNIELDVCGDIIVTIPSFHDKVFGFCFKADCTFKGIF